MSASESATAGTELSPLQRALLSLDRMQSKLAAAENALHEPIAILGMGCRFPGGVENPGDLWRLLLDGRDAVTEVPADRWNIDDFYDPDPDAPGKMWVRSAGFIDDVAGFDPMFFGIAPREASSMDPQQRLLLEVAWEALEHAAIAPDGLAESATGVFVGMTTSDYTNVQLEAAGLASLDAYYASGSAHSIASGRLSYLLGLRGPSITLDTACSSSLVAVNLAVQSLRAGESSMALAGGVNLMLSPENSITLSKYRMLSPDGRCKTFDAAADGIARGEGCGMVVLKRLRDATADGDRVLGVIRGSATNQDGASSGLTAPNGPSQQAVIRAALADGGIDPLDVTYVEAHGTGTPLGDPIEVQSLAAALGEGRRADSPLAIGSVKTNVGHLEGVAGVAGLMKAVLVLQHAEIPPHLHLDEPNPLIDWESMPIVVPTERSAFPPDSPRIAGVSAFGFSGTNAHVVLEAAPEPADEPADMRPVRLLTVSARTESALRTAAERHAAHLEAHPDLSLTDVCATTNVGRAHLAHRATVLAHDLAEARDRLRALSTGDLPAETAIGEIPTDEPRVAFMFTGQGAQSAGMALRLRDREPAFRDALDDVVARFDHEFAAVDVAVSLSDVLFAENGSSRSELLSQTLYTQASLFCIETALVELWRSWGVTPGAVIGHSLGEIVGATIAGVLPIDDAVRLVTARGRLMQSLPAGGSMLAVHTDSADVESSVAAAAANGAIIAVAAINGPAHVVVSGTGDDVAAFAADCDARGLRTQELVVSHAFHSPLMAPMIEEFRAVARSLSYQPPTIRMISNVTGESIGREAAEPDYWVDHVLAPVRFADGVSTLRSMGIDTFLEIGPHPVLTGMGQACVEPGSGTWAASLHRKKDDHHQILTAVGALHRAGVDIDWRALEAPHGGRRIELPSSPFQRSPYWVEQRRRPRTSASGDHPLLGTKLDSPMRTVSFESEIAVDTVPILGDHRVFDTAILPATAYVEIALAAGRTVLAQPALCDVVIHEALVADERLFSTVQTILTPDADGATVEIHSRRDDAADWTLHFSCRVVAARREMPTVEPGRLDTIRERAERDGHVVTGAAHDALMSERGLVFGPSLTNVRQVWIDPVESLGHVALDEREANEAHRYSVHPALLDAAIQALADVSSTDDETYLPIGIDSLTVFGDEPVVSGWSLIVPRPSPDTGRRPETIAVDVVLLDESERPVVAVDGIRLKRTDPAALRRLGAGEPTDAWRYEVAWESLPEPGAASSSVAADLPAVGTVAVDTAPSVARLHVDHDITHYAGLLDELERLSTDYIVAAVRDLGVVFAPGERFDANELAVIAEYDRLLPHLLGFLAEDGLLRTVDNGWEVTRAVDPVIDDARIDDLLERYPNSVGEITITQRCGDGLAGALNGSQDPLQLLFPGGSLDAAEQMYQKSPFAHFYNSLAGEAVANAVAGLRPDQHVRILEIGAGTGGTSSYVLPRLPADRTSYVYTDVSFHFTNRAQEKFATYDFVEYRTLDIEADPVEQGLDLGSFDIVVAANVLHATTDLAVTFANVTSLLAPNGILAMVESVIPQRFIAISFGLTEGWWKFTDTELRPDSLLLSLPGWRAFLADHGFVESHMLPGEDGPDDALSFQSVIVAQRDDTRAARASGSTDSERWLIFADEGEPESDSFGHQLAGSVTATDGHATVVTPGDAFRAVAPDHYEVDPADPAGIESLLDALADRTIDHVVHLWGIDAGGGETVRDRARRPLESSLSLVRSLTNRGLSARTTWVTVGAQAVGGSTADPTAALLWGFAKTVALEHPELRPLCVDLDPSDAPTGGFDADALRTTILGAGDEDQIALRGMTRLGARLVRSTEQTASDPVELTFAERGTLDNLTLVPLRRRPPEHGEVEIDVRATGLNFKDVLNVLGMYPGDPGPLGGECAGVVLAVGDGVEGLAVGDRVAALAPGAFRSHVTCDATFVVPIPATTSFADGAALLTTAITAEFSLDHLADLRRGERVLIHAAAGGVGLAAVALAQRVGAEIYATAGNDDKRSYLRSLGVDHVYDSRSLGFADEIRSDTNDEGVDVVLNSLAGDFVGASLGLLREGGRFCEIGKSDHLSSEHAASLGRGIDYHVIDWSESTRSEPELIRAMMDRIVGALADGGRQPLPITTFALDTAGGDVRGAADAFRHMAQARHMGKIVITQPTATRSPVGIRSDGTYLVTGGLTGLGLLTARHLASRGARHVALLGRRSPDAAALETIEELRGEGVDVSVYSADVSDRDDVARVLDDIASRPAVLRGVFHSAGALDPAPIGNMTWEQFARVLAPKADGADLLDELTSGLPIDHFVMYASIASILGSPGQANHSAANASLDALAHRRAAKGLPALSIDWGGWSEIGAAADRGMEQTVGEIGIGIISPDDGIAVLDRLLAGSCPHVAVSPIDWTVFGQRFAGRATPPFLAGLVDDARGRSDHTTATESARVDLAAQLADLPADRRSAALLDFVREQAARVLAVGVDEIGDRVPLSELGLDSLMAVELRNLLGAAVDSSNTIPATLVFDYPTVEAVAGFLSDEAFGDLDGAPPVSSPVTEPVAESKSVSGGSLVASLLDDLDDLSDDEIDARLARRNQS